MMSDGEESAIEMHASRRTFLLLGCPADCRPVRNGGVFKANGVDRLPCREFENSQSPTSEDTGEMGLEFVLLMVASIDYREEESRSFQERRFKKLTPPWSQVCAPAAHF